MATDTLDPFTASDGFRGIRRTLTREDNAKGGAERRLRTAAGARKLVADVLKRLEKDWLGDPDDPRPRDPAVGKIIIEGAKVLVALIEASDTEERLRRLERAGGTRVLAASPVLERPQPPPRRAYVAPDRRTAGEDASASPEASAALDTPDKP